MRILHDCQPPRRELPHNATMATWTWKCPTCKQVWGCTQHHFSLSSERLWPVRRLKMKPLRFSEGSNIVNTQWEGPLPEPASIMGTPPPAPVPVSDEAEAELAALRAAVTNLADDLTPVDERRDWPEHISNRVRSLLAAAPTETEGTPDE